jgi:RNA polymerase sigma-70 factor (ECF subfamily)
VSSAQGERLFRDHVDALHSYAARRVGEQVADDIVAETFRIAIEQRDRYDASRGSERAWLFGIATNLLRRHWRTETRRLRAMSRHATLERVGVGDPLLPVVERTDAATEVSLLLAAVAELAIEDRDLLVLVAWEGWSHRDIAEVLDIPTGTVRSRLHRIRSQLRAAIDNPSNPHDSSDERPGRS